MAVADRFVFRGGVLRQLRERNKLSRLDLARVLRTYYAIRRANEDTIRLHEHGTRQPGWRYAVAYAEVFEVSLDAFRHMKPA